jgi:hypothetical protein
VHHLIFAFAPFPFSYLHHHNQFHGRLGGFTTPRRWSAAPASGDSGEDPKLFQFNAIAVHGDEPYEGLDNNNTSSSNSSSDSPGFGVWSSLRREVERPIGAPDVVLHLGGQVGHLYKKKEYSIASDLKLNHISYLSPFNPFTRACVTQLHCHPTGEHVCSSVLSVHLPRAGECRAQQQC